MQKTPAIFAFFAGWWWLAMRGHTRTVFQFGGLAIGRTMRLGWFCWRKQSEEEHGEGEGFTW